MKNEGMVKVRRSKYEYNTSEDQGYWRNFVEEIERISAEQCKKTTIQLVDLSQILPSKLYNRVSKIIKLPPVEETYIPVDNEYLPNDSRFNSKRTSNLPEYMMTPELHNAEAEYVKIELTIDPKPASRRPKIEEIHWMGKYFKTTKKDRIVWKSKLFAQDQKFSQQSLFNQAEDLIDMAAQDFCDWINDLSPDSEITITKDLIKQLFSIGIEGEAAKALYVEPKIIKAIPNDVAKLWGLTEVALEENLERIKKSDNKILTRKPKLVAFGKTLPIDLRLPIPFSEPEEYVPVFPEEMKTREVVFRAISHLRSSKAFIQHLIDNPAIPKPDYLFNKNNIKKTKEVNVTTDVPLYEYFIDHNKNK